MKRRARGLATVLAGAVLASAAAPAGPAPLRAQTVRGTVIDADYRRPVAGAAVLLLDTLAVTLDSTATDVDGRFRLTAPSPGAYLLHVHLDGYLAYSDAVSPAGGETIERRIEMPVISHDAARVMREVIDREAAFRLPWEELCGGPVRPWEAGVLVGVSRDRGTLEPVPGAVLRLEPSGDEPDTWPATRVATGTGAFWFCNVPPGRARVVARADGFAADTSVAVIRAGTISWYDALLRRR